MRIGVVVLNYNDWQTTTRNVNHIKTLKNISCIVGNRKDPSGDIIEMNNGLR